VSIVIVVYQRACLLKILRSELGVAMMIEKQLVVCVTSIRAHDGRFS
jgi:hypothetical protein